VRTVAIVLAAGASTRFGSPKLLADLAGRPVLQHVLDAVAGAGLTEVVVVVGDGHEAVERSLDWRGERRVVNPRPQDGLSSSVQVGLRAIADDPGVDAAIVLLGDQPAVRPDAIGAVIRAAEATGRPFVRARYARDGAPNPVLIRREAWAEAAALEGDRGLGPLLAANPERVETVDVDGANPDVDTREDLERVAEGLAEGLADVRARDSAAARA
jgi:molybdenum cofactor cytidylyltransferase